MSKKKKNKRNLFRIKNGQVKLGYVPKATHKVPGTNIQLARLVVWSKKKAQEHKILVVLVSGATTYQKATKSTAKLAVKI